MPGTKARAENHPRSWDLDKPESGASLVLEMVTGEKNRETQSHAGAGAVRRTLTGASHQRALQCTCGQAECMWSRRATEGHGHGGTGEGKPLRATDKEEGKREGRPLNAAL